MASLLTLVLISFSASLDNWTCRKCTLCLVCGGPDNSAEDTARCATCKNVFHHECMQEAHKKLAIARGSKWVSQPNRLKICSQNILIHGGYLQQTLP